MFIGLCGILSFGLPEGAKSLIFVKSTLQLLKEYELSVKWGVDFYVSQNNYSICIYVGLKYRFCVILNKFGRLVFAPALASH